MTDEQLLVAWANGDERSGELLYKKYFGLLYRFFRFKSPLAIEDLTQITLEKMLRSVDKYEGRSNLRTFSLGIARNVLLQHLRWKRRDRLDFDADILSHEDLDPSPLQLVAEQRQHRLLLRGLRRLSINDQILIELHYWERMSSIEIGNVLNISPSTIRDRRIRARRRLKKLLEELASNPQDVESSLMGLETWVERVRSYVHRAYPE
ncbi:MAG: sigma-70 family RNA polymerase sigma factor [Myxococcota bacterium]